MSTTKSQRTQVGRREFERLCVQFPILARDRQQRRSMKTLAALQAQFDHLAAEHIDVDQVDQLVKLSSEIRQVRAALERAATVSPAGPDPVTTMVANMQAMRARGRARAAKQQADTAASPNATATPTPAPRSRRARAPDVNQLLDAIPSQPAQPPVSAPVSRAPRTGQDSRGFMPVGVTVDVAPNEFEPSATHANSPAYGQPCGAWRGGTSRSNG